MFTVHEFALGQGWCYTGYQYTVKASNRLHAARIVAKDKGGTIVDGRNVHCPAKGLGWDIFPA
jgi:hypothetical protein